MNNFLSLLNQPQFYLPFLIWTLVWKGLALWKAANKKQLIWFILLLIVNTMSLFEIIYIFFLNRWDIDNGKTLQFFQKKFKKKLNN
jgi:methionyl-tRNA synthetase